MNTQKNINIKQPNSTLQEKLSQELSISRILAQVLINRGIETAEDGAKFLNPNLEDLLSPWQLKGIKQAVERIRKAAQNKHKTLIFGDYDVDGITSVALLKIHLEHLGLPVVHYIPHRIDEGYGLNTGILKIAKQAEVKLIITVDCGINSYSLVEKLQKQGIDVIVTDHHEPGDKIPPAVAVINPKQKDCPYPYKQLSGVGVVFKLVQAFTNEKLWQDLDLVALGTIADRCVLNGENRIMAKEGLRLLSTCPRPGIEALIVASGIKKERPIETSSVGFILGPRINASGRVSRADSALELLLSKSAGEAEELAKLLNSHNRRRQKIEAGVLREVNDLIDKEINFQEHSVIVVSGQDWHLGVLGIVASKLMDKFYRPVVLISEGENLCRGSARSIKDFSIFQALSHCSQHLEDFGGHKYAAGLVISKQNIQDFRRDINSFASQTLLKQHLKPSIDTDGQVCLFDLNLDIVRELNSLEPFGTGNPQPLFYASGLRLRDEPRVLARDTLKFWVTDEQRTYQVIAFGQAYLEAGLKQADELDLVFRPKIDNWQGNQDLILQAQEIIFR